MQCLQLIRSVPRTFMRALTGARASRRLYRCGLGLLAAVGLVGCGGLEPVAEYTPITDPAQLYSKLTLNYRAATLSMAAGYDTLQLVATPRNMLGEPLLDLPAPVFTSIDTASLKVTPAGLVTARSVGVGLRVVASLAILGNNRQVDTAFIDVTDLANPPVLESVSLDPVAPDSAKLGMGVPLKVGVLGGPVGFGGANNILDPSLATPLVARVVDAEGAPIVGLRTDYWSLDSAVATVDRHTGVVTRIRPGQVRFVAQARAYGITKTATAAFTVTGYSGLEFTIQRNAAGAVTIVPGEVRIIPYGHAFWSNLLDVPAEVTFEDPSNVLESLPAICSFLDLPLIFFPDFFGPGPHCNGDGNMVIPTVPPNPFSSPRGAQGRRFPVPGVYTFHVGGATGRVIVSAPAVP